VVRAQIFRALRHGDFRRFFIAQAVSILGTWLQQIALSWLVYRTTGSAFLLGVVTLANQGPMLLVSPLAGLAADRFDRRRLLILTQSLAAGQAAVLAVLTFTGGLRTWHIVVLAVVYGIANGLDTPVRHSLFVRLIGDREDLPNAIALNSFLMNAGRLIGPSIAGLMLLLVDEGVCFLLNALSYLGTVWFARSLPPQPVLAARTQAGWAASLAEAARYAWHQRVIRWALALVASIGFFASSYTVLMPVLAKDVFGGGSETLGFLVGAAGLGALVGTAYLAARGRPRILARRLMYTATLAGLALVAAGNAPSAGVAIACMIGVGFGIIVTAASANMILQSIVTEDMRGRVVSFYAAAFMGIMPLGGFAAGSLASHFGAPATIAVFGTCCAMAGLFIGLRLRHAARQIENGKTEPS